MSVFSARTLCRAINLQQLNRVTVLTSWIWFSELAITH